MLWTMENERRYRMRRLEGRDVNVALSGGTRIDGAHLVSAGGRTLWIFTDGADRFVPVEEVVDLWESAA